MDEDRLGATAGAEALDDAQAAGSGDEAAPRALRPEFADPENWHDLAERGTPRNG